MQEAAQSEASAVKTAQHTQLVDQVLLSRTFSKAHRLAQFLQFICTRALEGRTDEINEQQIGVHVFGRSPSYSPADDSVVRTQARLLRQRLEEYFEHECPTSTLVISIPKGGYVPVFAPRTLPAVAAVAEAEPRVEHLPAALSPATRVQVPLPATRRLPRLRGARLWGALAALLLLPAAVGVWSLARPRPLPQLFWAAIFEGKRPVLVVPSDDGLVLSEEFRHAPVSLDQYLRGSYLDEAQAPSGADRPLLTPQWLAAHQYTSTADLNLALRLAQLPEADHVNVQSRYARVLQLDDLKHANVILIGGMAANPWVSLFSSRLTFEVNYDWANAEGYVLDRHPAPGHPARYTETSEDGSVTSYGLLAYVPGLTEEGCALLFEGSGMAGTEAAADFPFSGDRFARFLAQLGRNSDGSIPFFEVLLETHSLHGNAPEERILAWRRVPPA
jgi:hypothetical protein